MSGTAIRADSRVLFAGSNTPRLRFQQTGMDDEMKNSLALQAWATQYGLAYEQIDFAQLQARASLLPTGPSERIEDVVKRDFLGMGYLVDRSEGSAFHLMSEILHTFSDPYVAEGRHKWLYDGPKMKRPLDLKKRDVFEKVYAELTESRVSRMFEYWSANPTRALRPPAGQNLELEFLLSLFRGFQHSLVKEIQWIKFTKHMGMGWPDITCIRGGELTFTEVKLRNDKPTERQNDWAAAFVRPLGLAATVLHVV